MRVFTYGIEANKMDAIRWTFGKAEYIDVTAEELDDWFKEFYSALEDAIEELADTVTQEEFEALHLVGIQK